MNTRDKMQTEFLDRLATRLEAGAKEYGDGSFYRPGTAEEILEELLDVAGWAFVAWVQMRMRLQGLELAARTLDQGKHAWASRVPWKDDAPLPSMDEIREAGKRPATQEEKDIFDAINASAPFPADPWGPLRPWAENGPIQEEDMPPDDGEHWFEREVFAERNAMAEAIRKVLAAAPNGSEKEPPE